jgi:hypothetical protein
MVPENIIPTVAMTDYPSTSVQTETDIRTIQNEILTSEKGTVTICHIL